MQPGFLTLVYGITNPAGEMLTCKNGNKAVIWFRHHTLRYPLLFTCSSPGGN